MVHLDDGTYAWVSIRRFRVADVEEDDRALLDALIAHPEYRDDYAGGGADPTNEIHGPYRLGAITPETFEVSSSDEARRVIQEWADEDEPQSLQTQDRLRQIVYPLLRGTIYRLPDLRAHAEHEWGWVVGLRGFHEFVVIDRGDRTLALVVASDD